MTVLLLAWVLFTQIGEMNREVIDWDESTFILMGDHIARGNLPYVHMFDLKPPVIFLVTAATIKLFGKSLLAVRLAGDAIIYFTSLAVFFLSRRFVGVLAAAAAAVLYVALCGVSYGLPTFSELPAALGLSVAALLICQRQVTLWRAGMIGLAVSIAVLSRLNLWPVPIAIGLLLLFPDRVRVARYAWVAYALSGALFPAALVAVYAWFGHLDILKLALVDVPLSYAGQSGMADVIKSQVDNLYGVTRFDRYFYMPFLMLALFGAILLPLQAIRTSSQGLRSDAARLLVIVGAVVLSLCSGGVVYQHYWLQIFPFLAILAGIAIGFLMNYRAGSVCALVLVAMTCSISVARHAESIASLARAGEDSHEVRDAGNRIASLSPRPRIWAWTYQLVLWYASTEPLSKAGVQPINLVVKPIIDPLIKAGYVPAGEIRRLMASCPEFVVTDAKGGGLHWVSDAEPTVEGWLKRNYYEDSRFHDVVVFRTRTPTACST